MNAKLSMDAAILSRRCTLLKMSMNKVIIERALVIKQWKRIVNKLEDMGTWPFNREDI